MTGIEMILLFAVAALAAQMLILQRHWNEKLSDQAMVIGFLVDLASGKTADSGKLEMVRDKIFDSSQ